MKNRVEHAAHYALVLIAVILGAAVLKELDFIFIPFIIAYFFYFLFAPFNTWLNSLRVPVVMLIPLNILLVGLLSWFAIRYIILSLYEFADDANTYMERISIAVSQAAAELGITSSGILNFSVNEWLGNLDYSAFAGGVLSSTISITAYTMFVLFFYIFVMLGHVDLYRVIEKRYIKEKRKKQFKKIEKKYKKSEQDTPEDELQELIEEEKQETVNKLEETIRIIPEQIQRYIVTKIIINALTGAAVGITFWAIGLDYPEVWGILTFLLNFVPTLGSTVALLLPTIFSLAQAGSPGFAALTALIMAAWQTLAFNVIEPLVFGRRMNLNPVVILLAVLFWGYIWGIPGMLLAVPITAIAKLIMANADEENLRFLAELMGPEK